MVLGLAEDRFLCNRAIRRKVFQNCFRLNHLCQRSRLFATVRFLMSPNVLNFLVEKCNIAPITALEGDLKAILGDV